MPPTFKIHQVYYNEGYGSAGRIFAVFPLAALLCSPLASLLCRRLGKGKLGVWQLGLLVSVASTFFFGCSTSIPAFFLFRGLQVYIHLDCLPAWFGAFLALT